MSNKIQVRRGNQADLPTLDAGEFGFTVDTERLYIGNPLGSGNTLINFGGGGFDISSSADGYVTFFTGANSIAGDNDFFWDRANNRLGIGTDTPTHKLTVDGYITPGTDNFHSLGTPSLRWESVYVGPSSLHIASTAAETGIAYDWRIGIDQTTGNEGNLLFSQGEQSFLIIDPVTSTIQFSASESFISPANIIIPTNSTAPLSESGFGKIFVDTSGELNYVDDNSNTVQITTNGSLNAGAGSVTQPSGFTAGDGYLAFFTGNEQIAGDNDLFWDRALNRLGIGSTNLINTVEIGDVDNHGDYALAIENSTGWGLVINSSPGVSTSHYALSIFSEDIGELFTVRNSGLVGIGTAAPSEKLDVRGNLFVAGSILNDDLSQSFQSILQALDGYGAGSGDVAQTSGFTGADGYVAFFTGDGEIAGDNDFFWDREEHKLILSGTIEDSLEADGNIVANKDIIVGGSIINSDLSQSFQSITQALDGYGSGSGNVNQAPGFTGADGYVAFFTGDGEVAGDNDLFWNRANHKLTLSGTLNDSIESSGNIRISQLGNSFGFIADVDSDVLFEQDGDSTSTSITLSSAPQEGSILLLGSCFPGPIVASTGVDNVSQTGVTWTEISSEFSPATSNLSSSLWYGVVGSGAGTTITLTVTNNAFSIQRHYIAEFSGLTSPFQSEDSLTTLVTGSSVVGPSVTNFDIGDVVFSMVPWNSSDDSSKTISSGTASNGDAVAVVEDGSVSSNIARIGLVRTDITSDPGTFNHTINFSSSVTNDRHAVHTVVFSKEVVATEFDSIKLVNAETFEISLPPTSNPKVNFSDDSGDILRVEPAQVSVFGNLSVAGSINNDDLSESLQVITQALDGYGAASIAPGELDGYALKSDLDGYTPDITFQEFKTFQNNTNDSILQALDGYSTSGGGVSETTFQEFKSSQGEINDTILDALDGYSGGGGGVSQTSGFTGADGYVAFFTGDGEIAGDNDLFYDRDNGDLKILGGGKLGVGISTPLVDVDVSGRVQAITRNYPPGNFQREVVGSSSQQAAFRVGSYSTATTIDDTFGTHIDFAFGDNSTISNIGRIGFMRDGADDSSRAYIETMNSGVYNGTDNFTITSDGRVGIGTGTPTQTLHVEGNLFVSDQIKNSILDQTFQDILGALDGYTGGGGVSDTTFQAFKKGQSEINNDILGALDGYTPDITLQEFKSSQGEINDTILDALDGYSAGGGGVSQASGFTGADGYVAFFTGDGEIAGDNDFFYDRVNSELILTGSASPSLRIDGDLRFSEIGGAVSFATELTAPGISVVQEAFQDTTSPNPQTISFSSAPQDGNVIFLSISADSGSVSSVTQSGVTWSLVDTESTLFSEGWLYRGVVGAGASTDIVVTYGDVRTNVSFYAVELSGVDTSVKQSSAGDYDTSGTTISSTAVTNFDVGDFVLTFFSFRANPLSEVISSPTASNGDSVTLVESGSNVRSVSSFSTNAISAFVYSEITNDPGTFTHTATINGSATRGQVFSVVLAPGSNTPTDFNALTLIDINKLQLTLPPSTNDDSTFDIVDEDSNLLMSIVQAGDVTVENNLDVKGQIKNTILDQTFQDILGSLDGYNPSATFQDFKTFQNNTNDSILQALDGYGGGGGSPAGSDGQIQYNNAGSFGADANFIWDDSNDRLGIGSSTAPLASLHIRSADAEAIFQGTTRGIARFTEVETYQGGFVQYNSGANYFRIGTHDSADTNPANDINAISIDRGSTDVNFFGGIIVGSNFAESATPPTDGMVIEGDLSVGSDVAPLSNFHVRNAADLDVTFQSGGNNDSRVRFTEAEDFRGAYIHYNGSSNQLRFGTNNVVSSTSTADDVDSFYLTRGSTEVTFLGDITTDGTLTAVGLVAGTNGELELINDQILTLKRDDTNPVIRLINLRSSGTNINAFQGFVGNGGTFSNPNLGVDGSIPVRFEAKNYLGTGTSNGQNAVFDLATDGTQTSSSTPGKIAFATTPSGSTSVTVAMTIDSSQNVGIGRVATTNRLEIDGNASKTAAGDWLANSDRKIKENIKPISSALDTINLLNPVQFNYTESYKKDHTSIEDYVYYNFIAQDFQKVFPNSVKDSGEKTEDGEKILQVDTGPVKPYLVAAVQELHKIVKDQGDLISALKNEIEELKNK